MAAGTALAEEGVAAEGAVYKGVVFGDANGGKKLDAGEKLDGATVTLRNDAFREEFNKTTGPKGAFEFTGLQPHAYEVRVFLDGWSSRRSTTSSPPRRASHPQALREFGR